MILRRYSGSLGTLTGRVKFSFPHTSEAECQERICLSGRKRRESPLLAWTVAGDGGSESVRLHK